MSKNEKQVGTKKPAVKKVQSKASKTNNKSSKKDIKNQKFKERKEVLDNTIKKKYQTKLEIQKRKATLSDNLGDLKVKRKQLIADQVKLRDEIKRSKLITQQEIMGERIKRTEIFEMKKQKIKSNKENLKKLKSTYNSKVNLEKLELRKRLMKERADQKSKLMLAREKRKDHEKELKLQIAQIKEENQKLNIELSKEIASIKNDLLEEKNKQSGKVLTMKEEIINLKRQMKREEIAAKIRVKNNVQEIMRKAHKARAELNSGLVLEKIKYKEDVLAIKKKNISSQKAIQERMLEIEEETKINKASNVKQEIAKNIDDKQSNPTIATIPEEQLNKTEEQQDTTEEVFVTDINKPAFNTQIKNDQVKGEMVKILGRAAFKFFEKINVSSGDSSLDNFRITSQEKKDISKARIKVSKKQIPSIFEFVKYASFMAGEKLDIDNTRNILISTLYSLRKGKVLSWLNGYIYTVKENGLSKLIYSKSLTKAERYVISLPESKTTKELEKLILSKLKYKPYILIAKSIILTRDEKNIKLINDVTFMK